MIENTDKKEFDYEKEERDFLSALESGEIKTERITNTGIRIDETGDSDLSAFDDYLESDSFKAFAKEASY